MRVWIVTEEDGDEREFRTRTIVVTMNAAVGIDFVAAEVQRQYDAAREQVERLRADDEAYQKILEHDRKYRGYTVTFEPVLSTDYFKKVVTYPPDRTKEDIWPLPPKPVLHWIVADEFPEYHACHLKTDDGKPLDHRFYVYPWEVLE